MPITPEILAQIHDSAKARCLKCGFGWDYERHTALRCPYCNQGFTDAYFTSRPATFVEFGTDA